jgi:hypothetical protein
MVWWPTQATHRGPSQATVARTDGIRYLVIGDAKEAGMYTEEGTGTPDFAAQLERAKEKLGDGATARRGHAGTPSQRCSYSSRDLTPS